MRRFDRHGAARERVGIGEKRIGQQQIAVDRRQRRAALRSSAAWNSSGSSPCSPARNTALSSASACACRVPRPARNRAPHKIAATGRRAAARRRSAAPRAAVDAIADAARRPGRRLAPTPLRRMPARPERAARSALRGWTRRRRRPATPPISSGAERDRCHGGVRRSAAKLLKSLHLLSQECLAWRMIAGTISSRPRENAIVDSSVPGAARISPPRTEPNCRRHQIQDNANSCQSSAGKSQRTVPKNRAEPISRCAQACRLRFGT